MKQTLVCVSDSPKKLAIRDEIKPLDSERVGPENE
jgi:hypothetical protein